MQERNENFPNGVEAFLLFVALFVAEYVVGLAMFDLRGVHGMDLKDVDGLVALVGNGIIFTFVMEYKKLTYRELFHSSAASKTATILLLGPLIVLIVPLICLLLGTAIEWLVRVFPLSNWEQAAFARMGSGSFASVVMVCILAPVLEEMFFRGIILRSFLRQYPKWTAIVGSATLFGFAHMNLYQFVAAFSIGLFLGWLYERTRSLLPCIWLHAVYNSGWVLAAANDDLHTKTAGASDVSGILWAGALLLGTAGSLALHRVLVGRAGRRKP